MALELIYTANSIKDFNLSCQSLTQCTTSIRLDKLNMPLNILDNDRKSS